MKSLHKTFDILEFVFLRDGECVTPSEVARATGLNLATSARIMGELTTRGYLRKISRKAGYQAGPMIAALFLRRNPYEQLAHAAEEPVRILSELAGMPVNLSVSLDLKSRVMLCCHCPVPGWKQWNSMTFSEELSTPTERLLFSAQSETEILKLADKMTFPLKNWVDIRSPEQLLSKLRVLRKKRTTCFTAPDGTTVMGSLIEAPGYPAASIGFGIRDSADQTRILRELSKLSSGIEKKLKETYKAY